MDNEIEILSFSELERFRKENDYYHITDPRNSINTEGQDLSDPKVQQAIIDELMERKKMDVIDEMPISRKAGERIKQRRLEQAGDGKALEANKGGMPKQMEMFTDGGLKDEGGTIDPISGNDVPPGATQEEVRDDIPAKLSEGEFVFPADVVRFIGLEKLMAMRQKAKAGLKRMEEMGQMGNADEATLPDDIPFTIDDIEMEDDENVIKAQTGTFVAPQAPLQRQDSKVVDQFDIRPATPSEITSPSAPVVSSPIEAFDKTRFQGDTPTDSVQTFEELVGTKPGEYDEFRQYKNDAGMILNIPFKNGEPLYPIPEGYVYVEPDKTETEEVTTQEVVPETTTVTEQDSDSDTKQKEENVKNFGVEDPTVISLGGQIDTDGSVKDSLEFSFNVRPEGGVFSTSLPMSFGRSVASLVTGRSMVADADVIRLTPKGYPEVKIELTGKEFKDMVNVKDDKGRVRQSITNKKVQDFIKNRVSLEIEAEKNRARNVERKSGFGITSAKDVAEQAKEQEARSADVTGSQEDTARQESYEDSLSDSGADYSDYGDGSVADAYDDPMMKQGGLLKKKTKVKKMKRGGLASRK